MPTVEEMIREAFASMFLNVSERSANDIMTAQRIVLDSVTSETLAKRIDELK